MSIHSSIFIYWYLNKIFQSPQDIYNFLKAWNVIKITWIKIKHSENVVYHIRIKFYSLKTVVTQNVFFFKEKLINSNADINMTLNN